MATRYTVSDRKLVLELEAAHEGGYVVTSPLDPELITEAETIDEAFANARDAARALKQSRRKLLRRRSASTKREKESEIMSSIASALVVLAGAVIFAASMFSPPHNDNTPTSFFVGWVLLIAGG